MLKSLIFVLLIIAVKALDEDALKDVDQLIEEHGYKLETHTVLSGANNYKLGVHRIPNTDKKKVVLIMHQFLTSSADFVSMGNKSLAFLLADNGYDVWLGNARGNTYSRDGDLDPKTNDFWKFTVDDVGKEDLPAIIDFIINDTGAESIYYIGHGQGSTIFYIMASEIPEYQEKIKRMVALAPMAHMNNMPNLMFRILDTLLVGVDPGLNLKGIFQLLELASTLLKFNLGEMFAKNPDYFFAKVCDDDAMLVELCAGFVSLIYGFSDGQIERSKVPVMLSNAYAGSSFKQLSKYVDFYHTDVFSTTYTKLKEIKTPSAVFYGLKDSLVAEVDVERLITEDLANSVDPKHVYPIKDFNHIDFLFGTNAKELVYEPLMEYLADVASTKNEL